MCIQCLGHFSPLPFNVTVPLAVSLVASEHFTFLLTLGLSLSSCHYLALFLKLTHTIFLKLTLTKKSCGGQGFPSRRISRELWWRTCLNAIDPLSLLSLCERAWTKRTLLTCVNHCWVTASRSWQARVSFHRTSSAFFWLKFQLTDVRSHQGYPVLIFSSWKCLLWFRRQRTRMAHSVWTVPGGWQMLYLWGNCGLFVPSLPPVLKCAVPHCLLSPSGPVHLRLPWRVPAEPFWTLWRDPMAEETHLEVFLTFYAFPAGFCL
jgi:hypothetical protein